MDAQSIMETYITLCKIDSRQEFAVYQETQIGALYQPRRVGKRRGQEEASRGRGYMYTYG